MFHGCAANDLSHILRNGLRTAGNTARGEGVYLTSNKDEACSFGTYNRKTVQQQQITLFSQRPAILTFAVDFSDISGIKTQEKEDIKCQTSQKQAHAIPAKPRSQAQHAKETRTWITTPTSSYS